MSSTVTSDIIVIAHFLWIAFMITGFVLTVRAFWKPSFWEWWLFRTLHLAGILFVAAMPLLGRLCPLTIWEYELRDGAATGGGSGSFIIDWLERLIYPDLPIEIVLLPTFLIAGFTLVMYIVRPPSKIRHLFVRRREDG